MRTAVLIDGENISPQYIHTIMREAKNTGTVTIKRIYGDFTYNNLGNAWERQIQEYSFIAIQQFHNASFKNGADIALIIDAMDLVYSRKVDTIVLATSDSDFTALATRLSEECIRVIGMGESKTPRSLRMACDEFLCLDLVKDAVEGDPVEKDLHTQVFTPIDDPDPSRDHTGLNQATVVQRIDSILDDAGGDWYPLADLGNRLRSQMPDFSCRHFGYPKLSNFIESLGQFETMATTEEMYPPVVYVRRKAERKCS